MIEIIREGGDEEKVSSGSARNTDEHVSADWRETESDPVAGQDYTYPAEFPEASQAGRPETPPSFGGAASSQSHECTPLPSAASVASQPSEEREDTSKIRAADSHDKLAELIATGFYLGKSPKAPGTVASFAAVPVVWLCALAGGMFGVLVFFALALGAGWWATERYCARTGRKDPPEVVIDEIAGQAFALAFVPLTFQNYLLGFMLFRIFDIFKPWPVSHVEKEVKGAGGVMLDDVMAASYAGFIGLLLNMIAAN